MTGTIRSPSPARRRLRLRPASTPCLTGSPTISGTARAGETLTADTSGITDTDGLTNVSYSYQWIRSDGITDTYLQVCDGLDL